MTRKIYIAWNHDMSQGVAFSDHVDSDASEAGCMTAEEEARVCAARMIVDLQSSLAVAFIESVEDDLLPPVIQRIEAPWPSAGGDEQT